MRDSSLKAFAGIVERLSEHRGKVFGAFYAANGPICDYQAAQVLGWAINRVTGRRNDLERMGYLIDVGLKPGPPFNKEVHFFEVNPACLEPGFAARTLEKKKRPQRVPPDVHEAARILAQHRRGKKQKPVRRVPLPLFE